MSLRWVCVALAWGGVGCTTPRTEPSACQAPFAWHPDRDGDGFGVASEQRVACQAPGSDWVTASGDCDDENPDSHPGAFETCDQVDNDCNGAIDDGFPVTSGGVGYGTLAGALAQVATDTDVTVEVCAGTHTLPRTEVPKDHRLRVVGAPRAWSVQDVPPCDLAHADPPLPWAVRSADDEAKSGAMPVVLQGDQAGFTVLFAALELERLRIEGDETSAVVSAYGDITLSEVQLLSGREGLAVSGGQLTIRDAVLACNDTTPEPRFGSGLRALADTHVRVSDTLIWGNRWGIQGEVLSGDDVVYERVLVVGNGERDLDDLGAGGGVVYQSQDQGVVTFEDPVISSNVGQGGVYSSRVDIRGRGVTGLRIEGNLARHRGGGIEMYDAVLLGASIAHNVAEDRGGGAYLGGDVTLDEVTLVDNVAPLACGLYAAWSNGNGRTQVIGGSVFSHPHCAGDSACPAASVADGATLTYTGSSWTPLAIDTGGIAGCTFPKAAPFTVAGE